VEHSSVKGAIFAVAYHAKSLQPCHAVLTAATAADTAFKATTAALQTLSAALSAERRALMSGCTSDSGSASARHCCGRRLHISKHMNISENRHEHLLQLPLQAC
jgi:hypothetical protein